ncbi:MAG: hypothetical protein KJ630_21380, partial [Proteobacteria bacterium]|nr:hypothetical protein [Pseudomonadota bacterium]
LFKAALDDLSPYTTVDSSFGDREGKVRQLCGEIINWYEDYPTFEDAETTKPNSSFTTLHDILQINGEFINKIHRLFHPNMEDIVRFLEERKTEKDRDGLLSFEFVLEQGTEQCRCLTLSNNFKICLANISIDHIAKCNRQHKSKIICGRKSTNGSTERLYFRILTDFAKPKEASDNLISSRHFAGEKNILTDFGVNFDPEWSLPLEEEAKDGFTAAFQLSTHSGYLPRN